MSEIKLENYKDIISDAYVYGLDEAIKASKYPMAVDVNKCTNEITDRTRSLGNVDMGTGHDNYLKGIVVQYDWKFTPKLSVEFERYHFLDFISSQSTMHKITKFDLNKAYIKYVDQRCIDVIREKVADYNFVLENKDNLFIVNESRLCNAHFETKTQVVEWLKEMYLEILYSNPCGMYLTARMTTNYQQFKTIYNQRRNHRLPEWQTFCDWIETLPHFKELCLTATK